MTAPGAGFVQTDPPLLVPGDHRVVRLVVAPHVQDARERTIARMIPCSTPTPTTTAAVSGRDPELVAAQPPDLAHVARCRSA